MATRPAHFSRFGFLARCEKKRPISREKLRGMREIIFGQFGAQMDQYLSDIQRKITPNNVSKSQTRDDSLYR